MVQLTALALTRSTRHLATSLSVAEEIPDMVVVPAPTLELLIKDGTLKPELCSVLGHHRHRYRRASRGGIAGHFYPRQA